MNQTREIRLAKPLLVLLMLIAAMLSCSLPGKIVATPTPVVFADAFFAGYAYLDNNNSGKVDDGDAPLAGARFNILLEGTGAVQETTDASGAARIVIPGGWEGPVTASMDSPAGSGYTLLSPGQVILEASGPATATFLFSSAGGLEQATVTAPPADPTVPAPLPKPRSLKSDITYCTAGDVELKMDLYYPRRIHPPLPVVVYVHGGGWVGGDKTDGIGTMFFPELQQRGYLVASLNYRLAPKYPFPAQIEDVKCAIRHLRTNAGLYHLDSQRIGAIGGSAGGHLVSLLGLADEQAGWDIGENVDQSSSVAAVVDLFGPADLTKLFELDPPRLAQRVFGATSQDDPLLESASPVSYITPDDPPFLIIQGEEDDLVPPDQSQILYDQLTKAGIPAELVMVKNAGHGFTPDGGDIDPRLQELIQIVANFFDQHVK